jgi:hypothetical protein
MSTANIPYNNKQLLKWSAFIAEPNTDTKQILEKLQVHPLFDIHSYSGGDRVKISQSGWLSYPHSEKASELPFYKLRRCELTELVKLPEYSKFKDKLNWLYKNYSEENYELVWTELQQHTERLKEKYLYQQYMVESEFILNKQINSYKTQFGPIPKWISRLSDNQRALLLDRARTCYGLTPVEIELEDVQPYTVPKRIIKDFTEVGGVVYYSQEELDKSHFNNNYMTDLIGTVKVKSAELKRLAEDAVIRDAHWMSKYDNTKFDLREHREVEDTTLEDKLEDAIKFIEQHRNEYPAEELLQIVVHLYDIDLSEEFHNKMVPIADMQGPDSPYGLDIEFRDFQEDLYGEDEGL